MIAIAWMRPEPSPTVRTFSIASGTHRFLPVSGSEEDNALHPPRHALLNHPRPPADYRKKKEKDLFRSSDRRKKGT
jgi:hypothetical protein